MRVQTAARSVCLAAAAIGLCGSWGCTSLLSRAKSPADAVYLYAADRVEDALEMIDAGLTVSAKPGFAVYGHFASLTPIGAAYVDGHFLGIGGGRLGLTRFYLTGIGAGVWGYEELGWREFDIDDMGTLRCQDVGIGIILPPFGRPGPVPS